MPIAISRELARQDKGRQGAAIATGLLLVAIAFSIAMIALLWRGDPKRRRVAGLPDIGGSAARRLSAAVLLSGLALAAAGDSSAFLVWFGSCAIGRWLVAQLPGRGTTE